MSGAQQRAAELARFYFRKIAESAGWTWDGDNDVEVELMVGNIIEAAAERLRTQLDDALERIDVLDRLRPTCVICLDAAADRQTTRGPACSGCVGEPGGQADVALNRIHALGDRQPEFADEDVRARAEEEWAREGTETAMSASERAEYDQTSEAYLDAAEEARDLADDGDDYRGWLP